MYRIRYFYKATRNSMLLDRFVRVRETGFDGWLTRYERDAKTWKTRKGAERWIAARPGLEDTCRVEKIYEREEI